MSGNVFSRRYTLTNTSLPGCLYNMFYACKDYMDNHPGFSRISSYYGTSATGFGATFEDRPLGERAFCVWRAVSASNNVNGSLTPNNIPTFDVVLSVAYNEVTTTNPRAWKSTLDYGLTISLGWHASSRSWSGGAANAGADTFTAGANAPFSASSVVLPRSNGTSGTDATNRNGMLTFDNGTYAVGGGELYCTGDNDTISFVFKPATQVFSRVMVFGGYQRITSSYLNPLFLWEGTARGTDIGDPAARTGGGCVTTASNGVRVGRIDYPRDHGSTNDTTIKNLETVGAVIEFPITIYQYETSHFRPAGTLFNISSSVMNVQQPMFFGTDPNNPRLIAKVSDGTDSNICLTFPWSGSIQPKVI